MLVLTAITCDKKLRSLNNCCTLQPIFLVCHFFVPVVFSLLLIFRYYCFFRYCHFFVIVVFSLLLIFRYVFRYSHFLWLLFFRYYWFFVNIVFSLLPLFCQCRFFCYCWFFVTIAFSLLSLFCQSRFFCVSNINIFPRVIHFVILLYFLLSIEWILLKIIKY